MYQHVLLLHSDFSHGKRRALHRCYESIGSIREFMSLSSKVKERFKHLTFSFHHLQTMDKRTNSIAEYDKFFSDIEYYSDVDIFIRLIRDDTEIKPIDIAKIILSKHEFSPLQLQKILYFTYCEYMKMYGEPMFEDDFEAWRLGPVIPEVYYSYSKYGRDTIKGYDSEESFLQIYSRIMKIDKYEMILRAIDLAIEKYGHLSVTKLLNESHSKEGPWDQVYKEGLNRKIPKNLVKECLKEAL